VSSADYQKKSLYKGTNNSFENVAELKYLGMRLIN
jgi:hypothetical protein